MILTQSLTQSPIGKEPISFAKLDLTILTVLGMAQRWESGMGPGLVQSGSCDLWVVTSKGPQFFTGTQNAQGCQGG